MIYSSIFGELTRNVQLRFDAASEANKRLFDTVLYDRYLDWDVPTISLDFEEIIGKYNITIAAPTIGEDAKEAIIGSEGLQTMRERMVNHALTLPMTIQTYRKILQILDSKSISDDAKKQQLIKLMWGEVSTVVGAVHGKLDMIFLRALSNCGVFEFDEKTNPEGGVRGTINYGMPESNIAKSLTEWTPENLSTVDCFEDIQGVLDAAQDKVVFDKILCSPDRLSYICKSKQMKKMIFGSDKSSSILLPAQINEWMKLNDFPTFETIRRQVRVQKGTTATIYQPWVKENLVFVPAGKLGLVKNAYSNCELKPEAGVAYSKSGRINVSQFAIGETQGSNGVEFTKAESISLPVITEINAIHTLKTVTTKAND